MTGFRGGSAKENTLFLLDELGGGTEPRSGCAIAEAVLEKLYDKGAFGVVTTHFADLKLLADRTRRWGAEERACRIAACIVSGLRP